MIGMSPALGTCAGGWLLSQRYCKLLMLLLWHLHFVTSSLDRFLLVLLRLSSHFCKGVKYRHFCSAGDGLSPELLIALQSGSACCIPHFCTLSSFLLPAQCRSHFTLTIFGCLHMTPRTRQKANWHDQVFCHVALLPATWLPRWSGTCKHARP